MVASLFTLPEVDKWIKVGIRDINIQASLGVIQVDVFLCVMIDKDLIQTSWITVLDGYLRSSPS